MKKLFAIMLALVLILTLFAGCGNDNSANDTATEEGSFRGSGIASELDEFDIGDTTLDDINALDTEGSFRGSSQSMGDWESAADQG